MSVIYANSGNGLLGALGGLATLGGSFIPGAEWLTSLGMGMNAANAMMNGNGENGMQQNAFDQILRGIKGAIFQNPASGSMVKTGDDTQVLKYLRAFGGY